MSARSMTEEDYLKSIDELTLYSGCATLSQISKLLGTRRQSVYDEIGILVDRGLVVRSGKGKYLLSGSGRREANKFLRKHRVAEILLWKALKLPWETLDEEAMGIEHGMTEAIISRVCEIYGCERSPNGNPIPGADGEVAVIDDIGYDEAIKLPRVEISRVIFETRDIMNFLAKNGIMPGSQVNIMEGRMFHSGSANVVEIPESIARAMRYQT